MIHPVDKLISKYENIDDEFQQLIEYSEENEVDEEWFQKLEKNFSLQEVYIDKIMNMLDEVADPTKEYDLDDTNRLYYQFKENEQIFEQAMQKLQQAIGEFN